MRSTLHSRSCGVLLLEPIGGYKAASLRKFKTCHLDGTMPGLAAHDGLIGWCLLKREVQSSVSMILMASCNLFQLQLCFPEIVGCTGDA